MSTFQELGLNEDLLAAINDLGFEKPSDVQAKAIPILLNEDDSDLVAFTKDVEDVACIALRAI